MNRVCFWDNLKVILMMEVVITHSVNVYQLQSEQWVQYLWCLTMTYSMPLFTIISGFWYKERSLSYAVKHYLYPCILFSIVNYVGGALFGAYPNGISPKTGWAMWYLWSLFIYSLITPYFISKIGVNKLMFLSLFIVFVLGFKFISNSYLDAQRVVNFYPFYLFGIIIRKREKYIYSKENRQMIVWPLLMIIFTMVYIICCYYHYGFCYGTGFMSSHGFSLMGFINRWLNYILTLGMSVCMIMMIPNKQTVISAFGSRTMNVYLLHMSIIFPMCWWLMRPFMHEWYGYCLYVFIVPGVCSLLFSKRIDSVMKPILSYPDKLMTFNLDHSKLEK